MGRYFLKEKKTMKKTLRVRVRRKEKKTHEKKTVMLPTGKKELWGNTCTKRTFLTKRMGNDDDGKENPTNT
ncbi:MAG: hypothetical protein GY820_21825 [Gammaproteobacteria bacterium]|nr:hypothetical protein [Gammaproteobacteria bacterium]